MKFKYIFFLLPLYLTSQEIIDEALDIQVDSSNLSAKAQSDIEKLDEVSKKLYFEYKDTLNEYKSLKNYDDQLSKIIDSQLIEIKSINEQLDSLDDINIDILPLLKRMIDALRLFIEVDIPFLLDERVARVNNLDELILRSDVTTAEKYRKVFEAYQIESNFGKTIENYSNYITLDNQEIAVDYFRLGRLGLFYRTPDGDETGYWDSSEEIWVHVGNDLDKDIKSALDISNRQAPPNFITLPLKPIAGDEK
ncbi:DUF3450 domain-containing protein [Gammaproteobacteria bacterium]|jgi:hypothetical protein|nr:DUF3450 domain-containing protein [Gammaproteobacteria bacterium]